ncbi:MAG: c-type cytochrome [Campylobacterota bacterium]
MKKVLISSAVAVLLLVGCTDEKPKEQESQATEVAQETTKKVEDTKAQAQEENIQESVANTAQEIKDEVSNTTSEVVQEASKTVDEASKVVEETMPEVKKSVDEAVQETQKTIDNVKKETNEAIKAVAGSTTNEEKSIDAKALYASCATCHGQNGEKKALNASQIIQGWDKEKLIKALNGYKDGSYGGAMKGVMKGQVSTKTNEEIEALAEYISQM